MQVSGQKIVVLGTGGTIAGRSASPSDHLGYRAGEVGIAELLQGVPGLAALRIESEQVAQIDSKDMGYAVWLSLAQRCAHWLAQPDVAGVVVTHGTDTMEETAFFLDAVLAPAKPIVLTGAMRPASSAQPDGPRNIADAIAVASTRGARGVTVAFAGQLHAAAHVVKVHSHALDSFASDEGALLGYVEQGRVRLLADWPGGTPLRALAALPPAAQWPAVEIVMNHAGASGAVVRALQAQGVRGIVVAGTGNGTLHHELEAELLAVQQQGVAVRRASRCPFGGVLSHSGDKLPHAAGLSAVKARVAMLLELMP
jgi:L-asparaginase